MTLIFGQMVVLKLTNLLNWNKKMAREQLKLIEQIPQYPSCLICCYCGGKLIDADYPGKRKFGFRGWSEKDYVYKWYCWHCH